MDTADAASLFAQLTTTAGLAGASREPIRVWERSGVERLRMAGGQTVVFKYAEAPFDTEDTTLVALAGRGLPVPALLAAMHRDQMLAMLIEDLGPAGREAADDDGISCAVTLHAAGEISHLPRLGHGTLACLPQRSLTAARRHWPHAQDIHDMLQSLTEAAGTRAADAELEPFGVCHSEFNPTSVHIGPCGRTTMLDFARAFNGPELLDLASWLGTTEPPDPGRVDDLLHRYVAAGGDRHALTPRGGLPAAAWALGWHRAWAADWFIDRAPHWATAPGADQAWQDAVRRHLLEATTLLKA